MRSLEELNAALRAQIEGQPSARLSAENVAVAAFERTLRGVPGGQLLIHAPAITPIHEDRFTISGEYTASWPIPGLPAPGAVLQRVELTVSESNGSLAVATRASGHLGNRGPAVDLEHDAENGWNLFLDAHDSGTADIAALTAGVASGKGVENFLSLFGDPANGGLQVGDFRILFEPDASLPTRIRLSLSTTMPLEILPGLLSIHEDATVELRALHDALVGDLFLSSTSASMDAAVTLGSRTYRIVVRPEDDETWEIRFRSEAGFPDLQDLAALAGGAELKALVKESLGAWGFGAPHLTAVTVGVDVEARAIAYVYMEAELSVLSTPFDLSLWLPAFGLSGRVAAGHQVRIHQLLERLALPAPGLPDLGITDLVLTANPSARTFSLSAAVSEGMRFAPIAALPDMVLQDISLGLSIDSANGNSGAVGARLIVAGVAADLEGTLDQNFTLLGDIPRLTLGELMAALLENVDLPASLPDISLSDIHVALTPGTGALSLRATADGHWTISAGDSRLAIDHVELALDRPASVAVGSTALRLVIAGSEAGSLAEGVEISAYDIAFELAHDGGWSAKGSTQAKVFGLAIDLVAGYVEEEGRSMIVLSTDASRPIDLLTLAAGSRLAVERLAIELTAEAHNVTGKGRFVLDGILDLSGQLHSYRTEHGTSGIAFRPDDARVKVPLGVDAGGGPEPVVELDVGDIAVGRGALEPDGRRPWIVNGEVGLRLRNLPAVVQKVFPLERLDGNLRADGDVVAVVVEMAPPLEVPFPELALTLGDDRKLSLGQPHLHVEVIALELTGTPRLAANMVVGIPAAFNHVFGDDPAGTPRFDIFADKFRMRVGVGGALGLHVLSSPFKDVPFTVRNGRRWTDWDFGEYGEYSFEVPEFQLRKGSWMASAGFVRHSELNLPLGPLKSLLRAAGVPGAALSVIPETLPVRDIDLGQEGIYGWVAGVLGDQVMSGVDPNVARTLRELSALVQDAVKRLPLRMQEYFEWREKDFRSAMIDIAVDSVGGGTQLGFRVADADRPIRVLFPMITAMPELIGVTLRRLSFGQKAGGGLVQFEIDGHFDRFAMPSIIAAVASGALPNLSNRYILCDTKALAPTALPVPIPVFYRHLGFEYRDLLGLELDAHWHFPDPEPGLLAYLQLIAAMVTFLTDPASRLSAEGLPTGLSPRLTIGRNCIRLPDYLGGAVIGLTEALPTLDVADSVARVLDFLKTGRLAYLIQAIPLEVDGTWIRVGSETIRFGPLELSAAWCITTEDEFIERVLPLATGAGKLPASMTRGVLAHLPADTRRRAGDMGFVVLLSGEATVGAFAALVEFGMALTGGGGFETAFRLALFGFDLSVQIGGRVHVDGGRLAVDGSLQLAFQDRILIEFGGMIAVSATSLDAFVHLQLTSALRVDGVLSIGKAGVGLQGDASWRYGGSSDLTGAARIAFSREGLKLACAGSIYGASARVEAQAPGKAAGSWLTAHVEIELPDFLRQFNDLLRADIQAAREQLEEAAAELTRALDRLGEVDLNVKTLGQIVVSAADIALTEMNKRIGALPTAVYRTIRVNLGFKTVTRRVKVPGVNPRKEAQDASAAHVRRLNALKNAASTSDRDHLATAIAAALDDLARNRTFTVRGQTVTVISDSQIAELRTVRDNIHAWVEKIPGREGGVRISRDRLDELKSGVAGTFAGIGDAIASGASHVIPRITSIGFESELGLVSQSDQSIVVRLSRNGKTEIYSANLDFGDPAQAAMDVYAAFAEALPQAGTQGRGKK